MEFEKIKDLLKKTNHNEYETMDELLFLLKRLEGIQKDNFSIVTQLIKKS